VGSTNSPYGGIVQQVAQIQTITSQDGVVPCGCIEFGPSTDGSSLDASGTNDVNAVFQAVTAGVLFAFNAWWLQADGTPDGLLSGGTSLSSWGQMVATQIALNTSGGGGGGGTTISITGATLSANTGTANSAVGT